MASSILIADDNATIRSLLVRLIRRVSPDTTVADVEDGAAALGISKHKQPDIVLLDHGLPDMNGFLVLRQLKQSVPTPYVIMITGDAGLEQEALARGADEVWLKPMDMSLMLQNLTHILAALRD